MTRIVLVARDPAVALQWRNELTAGAAHDVVAVTNSVQKAQRMIDMHRPQLVVCDLRLIDGTSLAMIDWLGLQPQRPLVLAVARDEAEPLLLQALRAGADNVCVLNDGASGVLSCVDQTLHGETALTRPVARALLDHFEHSHAQLRGRGVMVGDEQSPLGLEAPQRELLMRLAAGYDLEQLGKAQTVATRALGQRLRSIVRKLQWDARAGSLTLQLS